MTLRKWFYLFWTSLLIGAASALVVGVVLQARDRNFAVMGLSGVGFNVFNMTLAGLLISVISQTAFFAYLTFRFMMIGMIRSRRAWEYIQITLICMVLVFGQLVWQNFVPIAVVILIISFAVAYWKVKLTNYNAFIPTLFFMSAATVLEAIPSLRLNSVSSSLFMIVPLIFCNAWQILTLHKIVDSKKS